MGLTRNVVVLSLLIILQSLSTSTAQSIFPFAAELSAADRIFRHRKIPRDDNDDQYCESWKFTVEANDAPSWTVIPKRCEKFVENYMTGGRYRSDSDAVGNASLEFVRSLNLAGDGKDAWIFDIDETLLSNLPYYETHGFGSDIFDGNSFNEWVDLAKAPAIPASLRLYKELQNLGFTIFLLTGRDEFQRESTKKNLQYAGYSNWERLILRGPSDQGTLATDYKSQRRKEIEDEGYRIHGNSGDQWSDLTGFAIAKRSFKLPNPMYYIA